MKKNMVRIVAALLVALLALTLIPLGAFAAEAVTDDRSVVNGMFFDRNSINLDNYYEHTIGGLPPQEYAQGETIKVKDFKSYYIIDGERYDFDGFSSIGEVFHSAETQIQKFIEKNKLDWSDSDDHEKIMNYIEAVYEDSSIEFTKKDIKVKPFPVWDDKKTEDENINAQIKWINKYGTIWAGYTPHQHSLTGWISDGTTHWKNCTVCGDDFIHQNWCQDGDEDKICNVCGGDVPYHDITTEGPDGYTLTLNRDNASHRTKITAKVDAPAGAQYKLHFIKVRPDGSEQEITRYKENGEFYTRMPTYPMKVVIETVQ